MEKKSFIGLFLLLTIATSSLMIYTINNIVVSTNNNGVSYNYQNNSSHEILLANHPAVTVSRTSYGYSSTIVGDSLYLFVRAVESNSTVYKILKITFSNHFSTITDYSLLPLPFPLNESLNQYYGLIYFNNTFITLQRDLGSDNSQHNPALPPLLYFIRFTSDSILSNYTVPFDSTSFDIFNYGEYTTMFPIQEFNSTLYSLRSIQNNTDPYHPINFILSEYSLPSYSLQQELLLSSYSQNMTASELHEFSHSLINRFVIDDQGSFWFSIRQYYSLGDSKSYTVNINPSTLQVRGTLLGSIYIKNSIFNGAEFTIQPEILDFQNKTYSVSTSTIEWIVDVSNNNYFEIVYADLGYEYFNALLGFRVTPLTVQPLPVLNIIIIGSSVTISVIGLVINYIQYRSQRRSDKEKTS